MRSLVRGYCRSALAAAVLVAAASNLCWAPGADGASPLGTLTMVSASQGGLLKGIGVLNAHAYRPNEFVVQNWVYDGLVHYGPGGKLLPALAESWRTERNSEGGEDIIFKLRRGVQFHDGHPWNADACKANFEQVFVRPLAEGYHSWYDLPKKVSGWKVEDEYTFRLSISEPYYPAIQELTLIRPLRFVSPNSLPSRPDQKSCPKTAPLFWPTNVTEFECVGITKPIGTGPLVFDHLKTRDGRSVSASELAVVNLTGVPLNQLHFKINKNYWDRSAGGNLDTVIVQLYESLEDVSNAVKRGEVDMVFGLDTIDPQFFRQLHSDDGDNLQTYISGPLSTRMVQLNSARGPTSSLAVRKAIAHAITKQAIIRKELANLEEPAYQIFSRKLPYCDVDLYPLLSYDKEKTISTLERAGWTLPPGRSIREKNGTRLEVEFLFKTSSSIHVAIEDDIRADLAAVGIAAVPVAVDAQDKFNQLSADGEWDLAFSETFGPPYDPHSFANNFRTWGGYADGVAGISGDRVTEGFVLQKPATNETLFRMISDVLVSTSPVSRQRQWTDILTVLHEQVVFVPISFLVNVAVVKDRYENFAFGAQQWDLPVHRLVDKEQLAATQQPAGLSAGAIAAIVVCSVVGALAIVAIAYLVWRERRGNPVFVPLLDETGAPNSEVLSKDAEMVKV